MINNVYEIGNRGEIEEWKTVEDFPDYEASNTGCIRSKTRRIRQNKGDTIYERTMKGKIIKPSLSKTGYCLVWLRKDNKKSYAVTVHRIVAKAFLGYSELDVNHKDGNKMNNSITNLEYVTRSENIKHAYRVLHRKHWTEYETNK
ncbi:MAG: HNH endonuclease [Prevotella sp.]|nr:HNH endonuclease [Candidatus Prevotella equi]